MRWLTTLLVALVYFAGLSPGMAAAAPAPTLRAEHRLATISASTKSRLSVAAQLAASVRECRRSADVSVQKPADPFFRIGFIAQSALLKAMIREVRAVGGLAGHADLAQRVLERETRRVHRVWKAADEKAQVAAIVRQLEALSADAARASGERTDAEINAFRKVHLGDIRYAGRRWLVDRKVGRQGAALIARGVRNTRLRGAIEELYRHGARIGDGGTADALLAEVRAGCRAGACKHFVKAVERRKQLLKIGKQEPLSAAERKITDELVNALTTAIRAAGGE